METCLSGKPCNLCCKLMAVRDLRKPRYQWCSHVCKGGGCGIYENRPDECGVYSCLWLQAELEGAPMIAGLKPSECGAILDTSATDGKTIVCHINDGVDWRKNKLGGLIKRLSGETTVLVREKDRVTIVRNNMIYGSTVCLSHDEFGITNYNVTPIPAHLRKVAVP